MYDAYSNYRRLLSSAGLINRRSLSASRQTPQPDSSISSEFLFFFSSIYIKYSLISIFTFYGSFNLNLDADELLDLEFVKENIEPTETFLEKWNNCFKERFKILDNKNISTSDYISMFPILKTNQQFVFNLVKKFIKLDFRFYYFSILQFKADAMRRKPSIKENILIWDDIFQKILNSSKQIKDPLVKQWYSLAINTSESKFKVTMTFLVNNYNLF